MVTVTFPGLGLVFDISRVAFTVPEIDLKLFTIPTFDVYWYGVLIGVALLGGIVFCSFMAKKFGLDGDKVLDVIIIGAVLAVVCGRIYYIVFSGESYPTFRDWIDLRSGGIAMYGVLFGAFLGAFIGCKLRKVKILPMFDMAGVCFMMASCIGRWGNFVNQEAFGGNTTLPWGMYSSSTRAYLQNHLADLLEQGMVVDPAMPVHPTFLYESIWTFIGAIFLLCYIKRRKFDGELFLMYSIWYGIGRAVIEALRTDSLYIGPFRVSQLVGGVMAIIAIALIVFVYVKRKKNPDFHPLYVNTDACKAEFDAIEAKQQAERDKILARRQARKDKRADLKREMEGVAEDNSEDKTEEKAAKEPNEDDKEDKK